MAPNFSGCKRETSTNESSFNKSNPSHQHDAKEHERCNPYIHEPTSQQFEVRDREMAPTKVGCEWETHMNVLGSYVDQKRRNSKLRTKRAAITLYT